MIKIIVQVTKFVIAVVTALLLGSCNFVQDSLSGVNGSGNVVTQTRDVKGFSYVSAASGVNVTVQQGNGFMVEVEADDNLQEHIITEVNGEELEVYWDARVSSNNLMTVIVHMPSVKGFSTSSAAKIKSVGTITSENLSLSSSSGSSMKVTVDAGNLSCDSSSGSHMEIDGKAVKAETSSSSGSSIDAASLISKNAVADASSGSSIQINASDSLDAESSSGSNISYSGNPSQISKKASSGGSVRQN